VIAVTALAGLLVVPQLRGAGIAPETFLAVLALVLLLFGSLTVEVDREAIRLRFGVGLVRKRIPLAGFRSWREVRNPWSAGWGIRLFPGGVLWNVSGLDAVELVLADGRRFRVGTDEPAELVRAIREVKGVVAEPPADPPVPEAPRKGPAFLLATGLLILVGSALAVTPFYLSLQPPGVTVGPNGFRVKSVFYGQDYPWSDVTEIRLQEQLPRIEARTNGFAGAGVLRGHFRVEGLGDGKLFVDEGASPYVLVRLRRGFVFVNLETPEKTWALYDTLVRARPSAAEPVG
jgi:hypothetical protein